MSCRDYSNGTIQGSGDLKRIFCVTLLLVLLSGCGGSTAADGSTVRAHFEELSGFEAHLKILSDLEQSVLEYEVDYVYNILA